MPPFVILFWILKKPKAMPKITVQITITPTKKKKNLNTTIDALGRRMPGHMRADIIDAVKRLPPSQIEAIDMARRGIHNEGASILRDRLEGKALVDTDTARRLFTLICVLHWG